MNEYKVTIKEFLEKDVSIQANSKTEAIQLVKDMYKKEDIILSSEDYITTEFEIDEGKEISKVFNRNIIFLNDKNGIEYIRDMKENQFYALDISGDRYANYLLLCKEKDTLWVVPAWEKDEEIEDICKLENNYTIDDRHFLIKFDTFRFLSIDLFYSVFLELNEAHAMHDMDYKDPNMRIVDTDKSIETLDAKTLHEIYLKQENSKTKNNLNK